MRSLAFGHPDPTVKHPTDAGFTLWLVEDFTQPLDLAKDPVWTWSDGGFQTHRFTRDAIGFQDGKMVLTLSESAVAASCSFSNTGVAFTGDLASCKQCGSTVRMACTDTCQ